MGQKTLVIKSGVENALGKPGGELFLLPGRTVSIFDFKLDLTRNELSFEGMCSSIKNPHGRLLKIVVYFSEYNLRMCTRVRASEEDGWSNKIKRQHLPCSICYQ